MGLVKRGAVVLHTGLEQCKKCWLRFGGRERELGVTSAVASISVYPL